MYAGFPELYGDRTSIVVSHLLAALLYAVLRLVIVWQKRQKLQ
jgi:hypothetical protein